MQDSWYVILKDVMTRSLRTTIVEILSNFFLLTLDSQMILSITTALRPCSKSHHLEFS